MARGSGNPSPRGRDLSWRPRALATNRDYGQPARHGSARVNYVTFSSQIVSVPEDPGQVGIAEPGFGVDLGANPAELVVTGVQRTDTFGVKRMELAPVRTARDLRHDGLEPVEVGLVRQPGVLVDRDVGGFPAVRGGEPDVVGRRHPYLDREHDGIGQAGHGAAKFGDHVA